MTVQSESKRNSTKQLPTTIQHTMNLQPIRYATITGWMPCQIWDPLEPSEPSVLSHGSVAPFRSLASPGGYDMKIE